MTRPTLPRRPFELRPVSLAALLLGAPAAFALPQNAVPTFGQTQTQTTAPGQLTITQGSARAGIDWTSFSIAAGERVLVQQPGRDSVLVNRVVGNDPSLIFGQLQSNGSVWLVNPRGIVFGAGSRVDVGGLVATTLDVRNAENGGRLDLSRNEQGSGEIRSEGQITARDGSVVMVAPRVTHSGTIEARRVGLAAATDVQVDVEGDGLIFFNVRNDGSLDTRLSLLGNVLADGGSVEARAAARAGFADTVLNLDGIVQARSLGQRNGRVVVDGGRDGITVVSGRIDVSGANAGERGGDAVVTGQKVALASTASVDASGAEGGGRIRVGGGWQGADGEVPNAEQTNVQQGARLDASATRQGDGGTVVVWSDRATRYAGHIEARGGAQGGDGGRAEVSGKAFLAFEGSADLGADQGAPGTLLLDPQDIEIVTAGGSALGGALLDFGDNAGNTSRITPASIAGLLGTNVELRATGDITVIDGVTSAGAGALILRADNSIDVDAALNVAGGVQLRTDNDASDAGRVSVAAPITVGSGATVLVSTLGTATNVVTSTISGGTTTFAGDVRLNTGAQVSTTNVALQGSTLDFNGTGAIATTSIVAVDAASVLQLPNADVTLGALSGAGTVTLAANRQLTVGSAASTTFSGSIGGGDGLVKAGAATTFTLTGANTFGGTTSVSAGTLVLGTGGSVAGAIDITGGATLEVAKPGGGALNNALSGAGTLTISSGTITLGAGGHSGNTNVTGGTLAPGLAVDLADTSTVTVANGATLQLSASDTVGTLVLAGTLGPAASSSTLSATTVTLQDGAVVNANLGSGAITSTGNTQINGTAAGNLSVNGGRLTLGAANLLADGIDITVAGGATLALGGAERVNRLTLSGTLDTAAASPFTLTATTAYALNGGTTSATAALGAGALTSTGSSTLNGTSAASTVAVTGGTLTLGAANRFTGTAAVTVSGGATVQLGGDQAFGTLAGGGTVDVGAATLSVGAGGASTFAGTLAGTSGGLTTTANFTLDGTATYGGTTRATAGVLTLGSADRLADGGALRVDNGATLAMNGNETVTTFTLGGTAGGAGTLTATTYAINGGTANAALGAGALTSTGGTLAASSGASSVTVSTGTLVVNGTNRFTATPTVNVDPNATLSLGASQATGLATIDGTLAGAGTLNASSVVLRDGARVTGALGSGAITSDGDVRISGTAAGNLSVTGGNLQLLGADRLADSVDVTVGNNATLTLGGAETVNRLVVGNGRVEGTGVLTATTGYAFTGGGTGTNATLGTGTLTTNGTVTLAGSAATTTVNVDSGTLALTGANRLTANAAVTLAGGATLALTGNQAVGALAGTGTVALGSDTLTVGTGGASSTFGGTLAGGALAGLTKTGGGNLTLTGSASYGGTTRVSGGGLTLGAADRLADGSAVVVDNGTTLALNGNETVDSLTLAGTVGGTGTLTAASYAIDGGIVNAALGAGTLTSTGGTLLASIGASDVRVTSGALVVANPNLLSSAAALTLSPGATLQINANQTVDTATLSGTLSGTGTLNSRETTLAGNANVLANLGGGSLGVTGNASLAGTSAASTVTVANGATLTLASAERLADTAQVAVAGGGTLALPANETVGRLTLAGTLSGAGTLTAPVVELTNGADVAGHLGTGAISSTGATTIRGTAAGNVRVDGGTLTLVGNDRLADGVGVEVASGATLALGGSETVATLTLGGRLAGNGELTANAGYALGGGSRTELGANLGAGTLTSQGEVTLAGSAAAGSVTVANGRLTLDGANRLAADAAVGINGGAALTLVGAQRAGTLAGAGTVELGSATLTVGAAGGSSTFDGSLTGSGGLTKTGSGSLTLTGASSYTGSTTVDGGTLVLPVAERLADGSRITVGNGGTLSLGATETVAQATINGRMNGGGTLVAASTTLEGGSVDANLGGGDLVVRGGTLNGRSAADRVTVETGILVLGSSGRFSATPVLDLRSGATLQLGGDEATGTTTLAGTLSRSGAIGTLNAGATTLAAGANVLADLGAGALRITGAATLAGSSGAAQVTVDNGGTLQLAAAERLADTASVDVRTGGTLALAATETVGRLDLAGTLNGPGTLVAGTYALAGGTANANLGGGALRSSGSSTLNGHADAQTVVVDSGTLRLGSADRLADTATVTVARNATLTLNGPERVGTLALAGTVNGTGALSADDYALDGGVFDGDIAGGRLRTIGDSTLNGTSSATVIDIDGGTLLLGSAGRFIGTPDVTVATGAALLLGGNETFGSLAGAGSVGLGSFTLTTGSTRSTTFSGALGGSGTLVKAGNTTTFTLAGSNPFSGLISVQDGTLALAAGGTLGNGSDVSVGTRGTLAMGGSATVDNAAIAGTLAGDGTLTAATATLDGGSVSGHLATGTLTSRGSSRADGSVATATLAVADGTLALGSAGRLASTTAVDVARDATLTLGGNENVQSLALRGTLAGSGALSAPTIALDGGTVTAALGSGALTSIGTSTLAGNAAVGSVAVNGGTLTLVGANRLTATPAVTVAGGAALALGGDERFGTLAGTGRVDLGTFTLATGSGGDSGFGGELAGSGGLVKQGNGRFTLSGASTYTGSTRVEAGTLALADGSAWATSGFTVDGTLRFERSDTVTVAQSIGGSGHVEQAGSGRLVLDGSANTYSGQTRVLTGELATAAAERLPDASDIVVTAGARFSLAGAETVNSIVSAGTATLADHFTARGTMVFDGPVRAVGGAPLTLSGTRIEALNDGNEWGSRLSLLAGGAIEVNGGRNGDGSWRSLTLGEIAAGGGGRIEAGTVAFDGLAQVTGGTLSVVAQAAATPLQPDADTEGRLTPVQRQIVFTADDIVQNTGSRIVVADGALLSLATPNGGSIRLLADDNRFSGGLEARSGGRVAAWSGNLTTVDFGRGPLQASLQGRIRVAGDEVRAGGNGLEADVIAIRADRLSTAPGATIAARLPFDNLAGSDSSLPALTLELTPDAFTLPFPFGQNGGNEIAINVGGRSWGARTLPLDSGYIRVLPRGGAAGATAVVLTGPQTNGGYRFFFDGAGKDGEIPVFYNGVLPATPQVSGSISATVAVSEGARKERFDDSVRTENVAVRLRAGVIAEVGPGRPATVGSEGVRTPATCPPGKTLACEAAN